MGECLGEVGFAGTGGADEKYVLGAFDEAAESQVRKEVPGNLCRGGEIETCQRLAFVYPGFFDSTAKPVLVAPVDLVVEQKSQEFKR